MTFPHTDDVPVGEKSAVGITQCAWPGGLGRDRPVPEEVKPLIGELGVGDLPVGDGERAATVFMDLGADVDRWRGHVADLTVSVTTHQDLAACFGWAPFKPVQIIAVDRDLPEKDDSADRVGGRDWRRPRAVGSGLRHLRRLSVCGGALTNHYLVADASNRLAPMSTDTREEGLYDYAAGATAPGTRERDNDKIGIPLEARLEMYEMQQLLRQFEKRAYDMFLQNLVKGTSHLSPRSGGGGHRFRADDETR